MYTGHGLEAHKDMGYHFNQIVQKYVVEGNQDEAYKTPGFFNLPVCELKSWNWRQSDDMPKEAPCDCRKSITPYTVTRMCHFTCRSFGETELV